MECYGYAGREIYIDLTTGRIEKEYVDLAVSEKFLGGMGQQLRRLYDILKPGTDPLSPENPLIIGCGPLVGTNAPGTPRVTATTKYPETGAIGSGAGAMRFGFMLKLAGYDQVIITGKAPKPVYIKIEDEQVEICDAASLWGKDIVETTCALWDQYPGCGVIAIGQAGENMVRIAQAAVDNAASIGRGGLGGIMGSKNLKALVAKGKRKISVADPGRFERQVTSIHERAKRYAHRDEIVRYGIMTNWPNYKVQLGYSKNRTFVPDMDFLDRTIGFDVYKEMGKKAFACPSCLMADKEVVEVKEGMCKGLRWITPSYLNACLMGARLNVNFQDAGEAVKFAELTDRYGIDQLSFSDLLDFLMTLYEDGTITSADVGGLPLTREPNTAFTWLRKTAFREEFGNVIADGWQGIFKEFGKGVVKHVALIKGRLGIWEPRISGLGTNEFAQLVYPRGPNAECGGSALYTLDQSLESVKRHSNRMGFTEEQIQRSLDSPFKVNIGRLTVSSENWFVLFNSLGICNRHVNNRFYNINIISELYSSATGIEKTGQELMKCAERVWNLFKMINVREGFSRKDDEPPATWFEPMRAFDGKELFMMDYFRTRRLTREDVITWLNDYYEERGWDIKKGIPTEEKLIDLGLEDFIPDLVFSRSSGTAGIHHDDR